MSGLRRSFARPFEGLPLALISAKWLSAVTETQLSVCHSDNHLFVAADCNGLCLGCLSRCRYKGCDLDADLSANVERFKSRHENERKLPTAATPHPSSKVNCAVLALVLHLRQSLDALIVSDLMRSLRGSSSHYLDNIPLGWATKKEIKIQAKASRERQPFFYEGKLEGIEGKDIGGKCDSRGRG